MSPALWDDIWDVSKAFIQCGLQGLFGGLQPLSGGLILGLWLPSAFAASVFAASVFAASVFGFFFFFRFRLIFPAKVHGRSNGSM